MKALVGGIVTVLLAFGAIMMSGPAGASGGSTSVDGVPAEYVAWVVKAGAICPEVSATVVATVIHIETGGSWKPDLVNESSGATGMAQFLPSTWKAHGMDGDGDGQADALNPADAIYSAGAYLCQLAGLAREGLASGKMTGDLIDLTLASYNAGPGAVAAAGGVPDYPETSAYIAKAHELFATYPATTGGGLAAETSASALTAGRTYTARPAQEAMTMPDPTPGRHGNAMVTPRTYALINDVMRTYTAIVNSALYCWDAHTFNPKSDHAHGRACDIPFYGCTFGDAKRSANPTTGLQAGNAAANWLTNNAERYGIRYVIWQGKIWYSGTGWQTYTGAAGSNPQLCGGGHYDHIHVSVW